MSLYTILGVDATATHDEIKAAYKAKAKEFHPDKTGGSTEAMQELNRAYAILKDAKKRKKYDETGGEEDKPNYEG
jgi:DnaJ-class molecular chaperone